MELLTVQISEEIKKNVSDFVDFHLKVCKIFASS